MTTTVVDPPLSPVAADGRSFDPAALHRVRELAGRYTGALDFQGQKDTAEFWAGGRATLPPELCGNPHDLFGIIQHAIALDIQLATAVNSLFFSDGKAGMQGSLMLALILRAGHSVRILQSDEQVCRLEFVRADGRPAGEFEWTAADAQRANITGSWAWIAYPATMLFWRTLAHGARRFVADVLLGFGHLPEELMEDRAGDATVTVGRVERPVDQAVQDFLRDLDILDVDQVHALLATAHKRGLGDEYAGDVNGRPVTVANLITLTLARLTVDQPPAPTDPPPAPLAGSEPDVADAPAGEGALPCGCLASTVLDTGRHRDDCFEQAWMPLMTIATEAAAAVAAELAAKPATPEPDQDVLGPALPVEDECPCDPFAVMIAGHSCGRVR